MNDFKDIVDMEGEFFEIDEKEKVVHIDLEFDSPADIFDSNAKTKIPMLNDDFLEWVSTTFEYVPKKHKLSLSIDFDRSDGYTEESLKNIFDKNLFIEFKRIQRKVKAKNRIAYALVALGIALLLSMILIEALWAEEGVMKTIFSYIADIGTTVTLWEALTILVVESAERRGAMKSLAKRFGEINFTFKDQ